MTIRSKSGSVAPESLSNTLTIFFGSTVQLAARLCSHAEPDQILVSNVVVELCLGKGLTFRAMGDVPLKGFEHPVRIHAVELNGFPH